MRQRLRVSLGRPVVWLALLAAFAAGCGTSGPSATSAPAAGGPKAPASTSTPPGPEATRPTSAPQSEPGRLCGFRPGAPVVDHVVVIWEENHSFSSILGPGASSEFAQLAAACGSATDVYAVTHPSLPNYLSMTSGASYARLPFYTDCSPGGTCLANVPSVYGQETAAGHQWRAYAESMPQPCTPTNSGPYAVRHNPAVYYPSLASQCHNWDLPMGTPTAGALAAAVEAGNLPSLTTLTPNVENDMHNGTVAQASAWLAQWIDVITAGPQYRSGHLAVVVAWDEGDGSGNQPSHVPMLVISASTPPGTSDSQHLDDYSVLRTVEQLTAVPYLAQAAQATSFAQAFGLAG